MTIEETNAYGLEIERLLKLKTHPVALRMLKSEDEEPAGALRPKRDNGNHLAFCQAISLARRQGLTVAMFKEDHWCFAPLLAYGIMPNPDDDFIKAVTGFPKLPYGSFAGTVVAPLGGANFEPDVVLIYADPGRLRQLLVSVKMAGDGPVKGDYDPIDSCAWAVVPVLQNGEYRVTVPDPGEHARAAASDDEMVFSLPRSKLAGLVEGLRKMEERERNNPWREIEMRPDFPRPDFYDRVFKTWGLDTRE